MLIHVSFFFPNSSCKFVLDSSKSRSGIIYTPKQTLPDNTVCTYEFQGRSRFDRVWLYFTSYFVPDREPWSNIEKCDVSQLEVYDSPTYVTDYVSPPPLQKFFQNEVHSGGENATDNIAGLLGRFCEKSLPRICSHANDYIGLVPPRPCRVENESYLSSSPRMLLLHKIFSRGDLTSRTSSFVARYEFVDTSQNGTPVNDSHCGHVFRSKASSRGRVTSPKNTFLYGRGGRRDLTCTYRFQGTSSQRVRLLFDKVYFASENCSTVYDPTQLRYICKYRDRHFVNTSKPRAVRERHAELIITELWLAISITSGCICSNSSFLPAPFDVTSVGSELLLSFVVTGMTVHEDFTSFGFEANYEFVPTNVCGEDAGLLRGIAGEAELATTIVDEGHRSPASMGAYRSSVLKRCRWLLEASPGKFLYFSASGGRSEDCGDSRLLVHSGEGFAHTTTICGYSGNGDEGLQAMGMFSPAWFNDSILTASAAAAPERLLLETLCTGSSTPFRIRWMEITRRFFNSDNRKSSGNCLYECPELNACISAELWCDGEKHYRCSPGAPADQHSPVRNDARVYTSQPPAPPLCLTAPAPRCYWRIDIYSLSSSCTTFSALSFARGAGTLSPLRLRWPHQRLYKEATNAPGPLFEQRPWELDAF
ncbi:hypothetical protein HPB50_008064 [Hyalomma asiaticum]|uniref:Uncharacterized protein n=1 Tax=Hyalomma asiaticum TaxID=266040 RepID=A0ACB7T540_HYAAI|nr:hypothetical protein HPB50_008064 [Hyalomma asiaticum]